MNQDQSRRLFIQKILSTSLFAVAGGMLISACNSETKETTKAADESNSKSGSDVAQADDFKCGDYSNVSEDEMAKRKKLGYEEKASDSERECVKCNLFIPKGEDKSCGGCILFKGPVNKDGSCTYWAEQVS